MSGIYKSVASPVSGKDAATRAYATAHGGTTGPTGDAGATGAAGTSGPEVITFGTSGTMQSGTSTLYQVPFGANLATTATEQKMRCKVAITVTDIQVRVATGSVGTVYVFTVRKNGADTALTVTLGATATEAHASASVSFAAGDDLSISCTDSSNTTPAAGLVGQVYYS